ncbi:putative SP-containing protein [Vairimorpha necatrix]|uniref:SP-containing protein n=1 Tax=Vairimorpha necatrix TaxID=6039 RepID=A0AAX4JGQ1_9MICR
MKYLVNTLIISLFTVQILSRTVKVDEDVVPKNENLKNLPEKLTTKIEDSTSSSSEDHGIFIKISDKRNKSSKPVKEKNRTEKKEKKLKPLVNQKLKKQAVKIDKLNKGQISPYDFAVKNEAHKPEVNVPKKDIKPTLSLDSTYKTPTSDFLLKDFKPKSVNISFTEKEIKDLEKFSKDLDNFLPSINKISVIVKNVIKFSKKDDENKNKSDKPSELFNIKVIEVSDGNTSN